MVTMAGWWKHIKKQLRRKRRILALGGWLLAAGLTALGSWLAASVTVSALLPEAEPAAYRIELSAVGVKSENTVDRAAALENLRQEREERQVIWQKLYLCGREAVQLGMMKPEDIVRLLEQSASMMVQFDRDGQITLIERVEDLSPDCKANGYFGLDKQGNLSLFDGSPSGEKVLRTFFQMNVEYMKSSLPREIIEGLQDGIRVKDLAGYHSVLSTFSDYAAVDAEKVTKPVPQPQAQR